jgi:hypothetical protein
MNSLKDAFAAVQKICDEIAEKKQEIKKINKKQLYENTDLFMDNESKLQHDVDYPTLKHFLKVNGVL